MKKSLIFSILAGLILFYVNLSFSATINVPGDSATIQAGINGAVNGDTVLVAPGTYSENIDFLGKPIVVTSSGGAEVTTLQPATNDIVIRLVSGEGFGTEFSGFTVDCSVIPEVPNVILIENDAEPIIQNNIFFGYVGNDTRDNDVVIRCDVDNAYIYYNLFYNNGGISCVGIFSGSANIINNTFDNNARGFFTISGAGMAKNNIVTNSSEYGIGAGEDSFTELNYNDVWNNNPDYTGLEPGPNDI